MDPERWAALRAAFYELIELGADARARRLEGIAAADPETGAMLGALLAADAEVDVRLARTEGVFGAERPADADEPTAPPDPLGLVGRTVAHFRVLEPIAAGGMGVVYRAEDTQLARAVALKFPLPEQRLDRNARERFLREARAAGAVDHPNLCSIYEAGETSEGQLYLAMALYPGETLRARIAREGALPIPDALAIAVRIARGLGAAHRAGVVHRDLKPANIVLPAEGGVKILDFGLARMTDVTLTLSRATVGTAAYMAPEQVRGAAVDARADLWALGVVLYEMLTGRRPFEGDHEIAVAHAIVHDEPLRVSALRPEVGSELERLAHRLLAKERDGRPASAEDVAAELTDIAGKPGVQRRGGRLRTQSARRRTGVVPALLVLAAAITGFGAWLLSRPRPERTVTPRVVGVLPLADQSADSAASYLALALTDAIATQLSRTRALAIPSELSTYEYRGTTRPWRQIAGELKAAAIVRGSVRRDGDSVALALELLDAERGGRRWAATYRAPAADLLALQRTATLDIAGALRVPLSDRERALLERLPTNSPAAYDAYLRARALILAGVQYDVRNLSREDLQQAQSLYVRARELDPDFATARARLAMSHMYSFLKYDPTPARREQARLEAEAALRLQPGLPEAHDALSLYWGMGHHDAARALAELQHARAGFPNSGDVHLNLAINYRSLGRWEEAVRALEGAIRFEPRYTGGFLQAALTHSRMRRYLAAAQAWDRFIALQPPEPDRTLAQLIRGSVFLRLEGRADSLAVALTRIPPGWDHNGMATLHRVMVLRVQRRFAEGIALLDSTSQRLSRDNIVYRPVTLQRAQLYDLLGDRDRARADYEAARVLLEDSVSADSTNAAMRIALGLAYAGLGRTAEAAAEAKRAMDLAPLREDNPGATAFIGGAVEVYAAAGERDRALELLELLLSIHAGREVSVPLLRAEPAFDPLRSDPRFEELLQRSVHD